MIIDKLELTKSRTVGVVSHEGKTRFNKIVLTAGGTIEKDKNRDEEYKELSSYIDNCMDVETNNKK